jgi:hypothetical protein
MWKARTNLNGRDRDTYEIDCGSVAQSLGVGARTGVFATVRRESEKMSARLLFRNGFDNWLEWPTTSRCVENAATEMEKGTVCPRYLGRGPPEIRFA